MMKHTQAELTQIVTELIMGNGLGAVMTGIADALCIKMSAAYADYERTNLRSSLDMAKAWASDDGIVRECLKALRLT